MARLNVWVPDELAARARARGLNVSALTQQALAAELDRQATDTWLSGLPAPRRAVAHQSVAAAMDGARAEFGGEPESPGGPGGGPDLSGDAPGSAW